MRAARLRLAAFSFASLVCALPALAADKPACMYVEVATVPVKYVGFNMEPTIAGSVNGKPARLLMDTGAMVSGLTSDAAEKWDLSTYSTGRWLSGVGGDTLLSETRVNELTVGPTHAAHFNMTVIGKMGSKPPFDAIIGAKFLLQADLEMDLANRQIKFFRPQDCKDSFLAYWARENVTVVPYEWRYTTSDNPHFKVELNGHVLDAMIDSGAETSVIELSAAREAGLRLDASDVKHLGYSTGIGADKADFWTARFDKLAIGDEIITNAQIGVIETKGARFGDMLLGRDFLRSHRVLFAKSQKKLYISYLNTGNAFVSHATSIEPWLQREADEGNPDAEYMLSNWYATGTNTKKDMAQATRWLDRASTHGQPRAELTVGRRLMLHGRDADAVPLLRAALDQLPRDYDATMWLYIARVRAGQAALAQQELAAAYKPGKEWPAPIAEFYLGRLDEAGLFARAAEAKTPELAQRRACGGAVAAGELYAAQGKDAEAKALLAAHPHCKPAQRVAAVAPAIPDAPVAQ